MKHSLLASWSLTASLLFVSLNGFSQVPCPAKGIRTDPANPLNTEVVSKTNTFNWLPTASVPYYNVNWVRNSVQNTIETPYNQTNNLNVDYLYNNPDKTIDGWELINRDLGFNDDGTPHPGTSNPYLIIYNKRTGILRVFWAIGDRPATIQYSTVELSFDNTGFDAPYKSGLLNHVSGVGVALEDTSPGVAGTFSALSPFNNSYGKWFMADFPMDYDPCTCQRKSKVKIVVKLIQESHINATGRVAGTLTTIDNGTGGGPGSSNKTTLATVNGALNAGFNSFNGATSFANSLGNDANAKKLADALAKSKFLQSGLSSLPYIGAAVGLLDFFIGGGSDASGPQAVSVQPMALDASITLTGTITTNSIWETTSLRTPGSALSPAAGNQYPYYNETLGVFNLLKAPVVQYEISDLYDGLYIGYQGYDYDGNPYGDLGWQGNGGTGHVGMRVMEDLQYVVNPASGLEVQDIKAALVALGDGVMNTNEVVGQPSTQVVGPDFKIFEGTVQRPLNTMGNNGLYTFYRYRSEYVDAGCLTSKVFKTDFYTQPGPYGITQPISYASVAPSSEGVMLKLMINLRPINPGPNSQNVLLVQTYPVKLTNLSTYDQTYGYINNADNLGALGTDVACTRPFLPQQSPAAITSFCSSNAQYNNAILLRPGPKSAANTAPHPAQGTLTQFAVYPNPVNNIARVRFAVQTKGKIQLALRDNMGRLVREMVSTEEAGLIDKSFDTQLLDAGVYYCTLETVEGRETRKVVIIK